MYIKDELFKDFKDKDQHLQVMNSIFQLTTMSSMEPCLDLSSLTIRLGSRADDWLDLRFANLTAFPE